MGIHIRILDVGVFYRVIIGIRPHDERHSIAHAGAYAVDYRNLVGDGSTHVEGNLHGSGLLHDHLCILAHCGSQICNY